MHLSSWLRSLTPTSAVEEIVGALRRGVAEDDLWRSGLLTAIRHLNNQAHNFLGFVSHAMIGCEEARRLAQGRPDHVRKLLIVQGLYRVVCDLHDPSFAPFELTAYWPVSEATTERGISLLMKDIRHGEYMSADHRLNGLKDQLSPPELDSLVLDIGLEGMLADEHTFITPFLCLETRDLLGSDDSFDAIRCAVRYAASFQWRSEPYWRAVELLGAHGLEASPSTLALQQERVEGLRAELLDAAPADRPEVAAHALAADGCSPATVLAAVSQAAAELYLMVPPVRQTEPEAVSRELGPVHIGTLCAALRGGLQYLTPSLQALAAIQGGNLLERGPSILSSDLTFEPFKPVRRLPYEEDVVASAAHGSDALLRVAEDAIRGRDIRMATAAVQSYCLANGAPDPLIDLLLRHACTDDATLLHNFKHLGSMVREFRSSAGKGRWSFLMAAARFVAWYSGLSCGAHRRAEEALKSDIQLPLGLARRS